MFTFSCMLISWCMLIIFTFCCIFPPRHLGKIFEWGFRQGKKVLLTCLKWGPGPLPQLKKWESLPPPPTSPFHCQWILLSISIPSLHKAFSLIFMVTNCEHHCKHDSVMIWKPSKLSLMIAHVWTYLYSPIEIRDAIDSLVFVTSFQDIRLD